ncbi:MAG: DUF3488 and transglutaminase-like domain-containing protein [Pseudohongiella sp.]|nr:DUF3488 and transglutaminase-like domain-containing protein [Pseudohongiella sp.]
MTKSSRIEVPGTLLFGLALLLPPFQGMAWWLILPSLITLVLGWRLTAFVMLMGSYLYAETPIAGVYLLLLTMLLLVSIVAARARTFEGAGQSSAMDSFKTVFTIVLLSIPVSILLMGLLASAGARWVERQNSGTMQTGISDRLSPDSVTRLVASTELALRVKFEGQYERQPPPLSMLYWRGVVLENFDGKAWVRDPQLEFNLADSPTETPENTVQVSYEVTQEPNRAYWLYGLNEAWVEKEDVYRDTRGALVNRIPVRQRLRYPVTSYVNTDPLNAPPSAVDITLDDTTRARNLQLPEGSNPLSVQWAGSLRQQFPDDLVLTQFVLEQFYLNNFFYTVNPPAMTEQGIDDFLFNQRQGFCGHYASALSFVLRAAGIPARVIGGYQGGEFNPLSNHLSVYQYHAHVWVEAWYAGRGWVLLDPTAWVAPERITIGMDAWLQEAAAEQNLRDRWWFYVKQLPGAVTAGDALDAFLYQSDRWFFDEAGELRTDAFSLWLEQRGLGELPVWLMAAVLLFVVLRTMSMRGGILAPVPPAIKMYHTFEKSLAKQALGSLPGETTAAHLRRIATIRPDLVKEATELMAELDQVIYGKTDPDLNKLKKLFKRLQQNKGLTDGDKPVE